MSKVTIVYFSGTGGTRLCAERLSILLTKLGSKVQLLELRGRANLILPQTDKLIIMYPVYFMNAPLPVQELVYKLESVNGTYAAVITVSAGGEAMPNLACRLRITEILANKGYNVVYENMLVLPSNCLAKPHELVAAALLKALPHKLDTIAADITVGKVRRSQLDLLSHLASYIGRAPQKFSNLFSMFFSCTEACNGCGICVRSCPRDNIYQDREGVGWENYCAACMNCYYACPQRAIRMRLIEKKFTIEGGYDLRKLVAAANNIRLDEISDIAKSYTRKSDRGIRKYLLEDVYIMGDTDLQLGDNSFELQDKAIAIDNKDDSIKEKCFMIKKIATDLYNAYNSRQPFYIPSTKMELDEATAYAIQREYAAMRSANSGTAGYKAAMTNPAVRAKFGVDKPLAGSLYKAGVLTDQAVLNRADYANLVLETELVYFAGCDISKPFASVEDLRACFTTVAPGIELADPNFAEGTVTGNDVLCVNTHSTQVIVGKQQAIAELDLNKLKVDFYHNGKLAGSGTGADALECQWACLLWLVNQVVEIGYTIKSGDIFFTGALGQVLPAAGGDYLADFGALGKLEFKVQ